MSGEWRKAPKAGVGPGCARFLKGTRVVFGSDGFFRAWRAFGVHWWCRREVSGSHPAEARNPPASAKTGHHGRRFRTNPFLDPRAGSGTPPKAVRGLPQDYAHRLAEGPTPFWQTAELMQGGLHGAAAAARGGRAVRAWFGALAPHGGVGALETENYVSDPPTPIVIPRSGSLDARPRVFTGRGFMRFAGGVWRFEEMRGGSKTPRGHFKLSHPGGGPQAALPGPGCWGHVALRARHAQSGGAGAWKARRGGKPNLTNELRRTSNKENQNEPCQIPAVALYGVS